MATKKKKAVLKPKYGKFMKASAVRINRNGTVDVKVPGTKKRANPKRKPAKRKAAPKRKPAKRKSTAKRKR